MNPNFGILEFFKSGVLGKSPSKTFVRDVLDGDLPSKSTGILRNFPHPSTNPVQSIHPRFT